MKTLMLMRHATASNKQALQKDSERQLNQIGQFQAENIAKQLQKRNCLPAYILCSPTKRTQQTAAIFCQTLSLNPMLVKTTNELYSGDVEVILNCLCDSTTRQPLLVIGHNPTLSGLTHRLCAHSKTIILPPAGLIGLEFAIESWNQLTKTRGTLLFFIKPNHEPN